MIEIQGKCWDGRFLSLVRPPTVAENGGPATAQIQACAAWARYDCIVPEPVRAALCKGDIAEAPDAAVLGPVAEQTASATEAEVHPGLPRVPNDRFARRSDSGQRRALPKHARGA